MRRFAVLAVLLAVACAPERVVFTDDEVPLAAPLEAASSLDFTGRVMDDPPARVVRLSATEGTVSRQPPGLDEWAPAAVNLPLGTGDNLWVAPGGKAELHAGSTGLRLGPDTGLSILRLDNHAVQLGLPRGTVELRVLPGRAVDSVEVDTPSGAVLLDRPGTYRVDADPDGASDRVTVRSGMAEVTAAGVTVPVNAGATMELSGGDAPHYDMVAAAGPDGFDRWCAGREQREDGSDSALYVGRDLIGYQDLDGEGTWKIDKTYGTAWAPRVAADWAPYRDGRWAWSEPYGWTWVDDKPWGFAPSHYGRWAYADHAWLWVPHAEGMRQASPVYAPALVAFVGGPGFHGAASAGGGVAWFPLGPREPYLPAYAGSRAYVVGLNAAALPPGTTLAGAAPGHVNQGIPGAMTVVPQSVFLGARPVAGATLAVRGPALAQGLRVGSAPALVPGRESVLAAPAGGPAGIRPPAFPGQPLMVRNRMPLGPVAFEARQQALAAGHGRPLAPPALNGLRRQGPARGIPARLASTPAPGGVLRSRGPAFMPPASQGLGNRPLPLPPPAPERGMRPPEGQPQMLPRGGPNGPGGANNVQRQRRMPPRRPTGRPQPQGGGGGRGGGGRGGGGERQRESR
jgi:hypothetical protein